MHLADAVEHDLRRRLGLLARRIGDLLELERLAELDGDLGELQALPVAGALGAGDRGRHHRDARLEGQATEPVARLAELAAARPARLGVHDDHVAAAENGVGGLEGVLVVVAAPHGEHAAVVVHDLHRPLEEL